MVLLYFAKRDDFGHARVRADTLTTSHEGADSIWTPCLDQTASEHSIITGEYSEVTREQLRSRTKSLTVSLNGANGAPPTRDPNATGLVGINRLDGERYYVCLMGTFENPVAHWTKVPYAAEFERFPPLKQLAGRSLSYYGSTIRLTYRSGVTATDFANWGYIDDEFMSYVPNCVYYPEVQLTEEMVGANVFSVYVIPWWYHKPNASSAVTIQCTEQNALEYGLKVDFPVMVRSV